jgi:hypothetical protein
VCNHIKWSKSHVKSPMKTTKQFLTILMCCNSKIMIIITSCCQMIKMNVAGFEFKIHLIQF